MSCRFCEPNYFIVTHWTEHNFDIINGIYFYYYNLLYQSLNRNEQSSKLKNFKKKTIVNNTNVTALLQSLIILQITLTDVIII